MTVAELIEELQKHPPHHVVVLSYEDGEYYEYSIESVEGESDVPGSGCIVRIVGEP